MALGSGWTEIGRASTGFQGVRLMIIYARLAGQDTAKNQSTIETHLDLADNHGSSRSYNTTFYVTGSSGWNGYWGGNTGTVLAGSFTVTHNDDGTASAKIDGRAIFGGVGKDTGWVSGTVKLPTIPRASQPSMNTWPNNSENVTAGVQCYVHMNRKSTNFTHKVYYTWGDQTHRTAGLSQTSGITNNVAWTPPMDLMQGFPNAKSGWGMMHAETYNGSTLIGTKSCKFTVNQPSDSNPEISASYSEKGTLADGQTLLSDHGVPDTTAIGQISKKAITITATAKYYSTIKQIICKHNGKQQSSTTSPATFQFDAPVNTGNDKSHFEWSVVDSRGNVTYGSIDMPFVNYIKPIVSKITPTRDSNVVSTGKVSSEGMFFNDKVGDIANDITVTVNYDGKTVNATVSKSGNDWNFSDMATDGVSPDNAYTFTVTAIDSIGFSDSKQFMLDKAIPTMWLGKESVRIHDHLFIDNQEIKWTPELAIVTFDSSSEAMTAGTGIRVSPADTTESEIDAHTPDGYEFACILMVVSNGFVQPMYPADPTKKKCDVWAYPEKSISYSDKGCRFVVLYREKMATEDK